MWGLCVQNPQNSTKNHLLNKWQLDSQKTVQNHVRLSSLCNRDQGGSPGFASTTGFWALLLNHTELLLEISSVWPRKVHHNQVSMSMSFLGSFDIFQRRPHILLAPHKSDEEYSSAVDVTFLRVFPLINLRRSVWQWANSLGHVMARVEVTGKVEICQFPGPFWRQQPESWTLLHCKTTTRASSSSSSLTYPLLQTRKKKLWNYQRCFERFRDFWCQVGKQHLKSKPRCTLHGLMFLCATWGISNSTFPKRTIATRFMISTYLSAFDLHSKLKIIEATSL